MQMSAEDPLRGGRVQILRRATSALLLAAVVLGGTRLSAQTTIGDIRDQLRSELSPSGFAALVSGFVSIDLLPQVSSGTFYTDNPDPSLPDSRIDTFKLPLKWETEVGGLPGKLHLGGGFGYLKSTESVRLDIPIQGNLISSRIDSISEAYNVMASVGWTFELGSGFGIRPMFGLAYSKVENEGRYDAVGSVIWKPILDGIVLNWDLQAYTLSSGADLLYREDYHWGRIEADLSYIHTWTQVFDSTDPAQEGGIQNDFLASRLDFIYRTGEQIWGSPMDWRMRYGLFHILQGDDGLGFTTLMEVGLGVELDLGAKGYPVSRVGLMGSIFVGEHTQGWTLGVTFQF
jgi:hypothetical protein